MDGDCLWTPYGSLGYMDTRLALFITPMLDPGDPHRKVSNDSLGAFIASEALRPSHYSIPPAGRLLPLAR